MPWIAACVLAHPPHRLCSVMEGSLGCAPTTSGRMAPLRAPRPACSAFSRRARQQRRQQHAVAASMGIGFTEDFEPQLATPSRELVLPDSPEFGLTAKQMGLLGLTNTSMAQLPEVKAVSGGVGPLVALVSVLISWTAAPGGEEVILPGAFGAVQAGAVSGGMRFWAATWQPSGKAGRGAQPWGACALAARRPTVSLSAPALQEALTARCHYVGDFVDTTRRSPRMAVDTKAPGQAPPDLPSLLLDGRICYIGMPVRAQAGVGVGGIGGEQERWAPFGTCVPRRCNMPVATDGCACTWECAKGGRLRVWTASDAAVGVLPRHARRPPALLGALAWSPAASRRAATLATLADVGAHAFLLTTAAPPCPPWCCSWCSR